MRPLALAAILIFSLLSTQSRAEDGMPQVPDVTYPRLAAAAETVEGFVPAGWKLESQAIADLNED
jgi:hypothetical protein